MILVVGSGGNGQTYFMSFLKKNNININHIHDKDGFKHLCSPDHIKGHIKKRISKCIFLYGHPYSSMRSHYRRGWETFQIAKLGNPFALSKLDMKYENYKQRVLSQKKDLFGIEYQFDNWINSDTPFPTLFLNFDEVLQKKSLINLFLEKDLNYNLFQYEERQCALDKGRICKIYNNLYITMEETVLKRSTRLLFKDRLNI
jgi:hypothetical protein